MKISTKRQEPLQVADHLCNDKKKRSKYFNGKSAAIHPGMASYHFKVLSRNQCHSHDISDTVYSNVSRHGRLVHAGVISTGRCHVSLTAIEQAKASQVSNGEYQVLNYVKNLITFKHAESFVVLKFKILDVAIRSMVCLGS